MQRTGAKKTSARKLTLTCLKKKKYKKILILVDDTDIN
jgi:hypothetical protein